MDLQMFSMLRRWTSPPQQVGKQFLRLDGLTVVSYCGARLTRNHDSMLRNPSLYHACLGDRLLYSDLHSGIER